MASVDSLIMIEDVPRRGSSGLGRVEVGELSTEAIHHFHEGLEHLSAGGPEQAVVCFEQTLELAPKFADAHVGLGIANALLNRIYPALDHLEQAAQQEPESFYAHFKLGQLYFKLRIPQKGYPAMSRALDRATSLEERKLVAQLLRDEKQREKNSVVRPWWNKPFSRASLYLAASLAVALSMMLVFYLR